MTILRTPLSDRKAAITGTDENFLYGLAGFWVFGGGAFTGISATHHDAYDEIPHAPELSYDLGSGRRHYRAEDRADSCLYERLGGAEHRLEGCDREGSLRSGGCGKPTGNIAKWLYIPVGSLYVY